MTTPLTTAADAKGYFWNYADADLEVMKQQQDFWLQGDGWIELEHPVYGEALNAPHAYLAATISAANIGAWDTRALVYMKGIRAAINRGSTRCLASLRECTVEKVGDDDFTALQCFGADNYSWVAVSNSLIVLLTQLLRDIASLMLEDGERIDKIIEAAGHTLRYHTDTMLALMNEAAVRNGVAIAWLRAMAEEKFPEHVMVVIPPGVHLDLLQVHLLTDEAIKEITMLVEEPHREYLGEMVDLIRTIVEDYVPH